ncbi:DNA repair protein RAD5B-like [Bidens hawaiensis]|uniref:DNA repair protein RAD5B-like n=1 Tax=Bidens hawaiensis TaxID=980011 RepID=UPI00404A9E39
MSLKAGGVGLNLTAASNVFLMDPWWNPAVEEQAIMRIHRIGQKRTVCVRRFIVKDTVEERMQQVQARKQRMIAGVLTDEEVRSARLEELKMLFR